MRAELVQATIASLVEGDELNLIAERVTAEISLRIVEPHMVRSAHFDTLGLKPLEERSYVDYLHGKVVAR